MAREDVDGEIDGDGDGVKGYKRWVLCDEMVVWEMAQRWRGWWAMRSGDERSAKMEGVDGDDQAQVSGSVESDDGGGGLEEGSMMMKDGFCVRWRWTCVKG